GKEVKQFRGPKGSVQLFELSRDGKTMASMVRRESKVVRGVTDDQICIWDVDTAKELRKIDRGRSGRDFLIGFALSPNGKTVAVAGREPLIQLWDVGTGKRIVQADAHEDRVESVGLSADGKTAVSLDPYGSIRNWDAATGEQLR